MTGLSKTISRAQCFSYCVSCVVFRIVFVVHRQGSASLLLWQAVCGNMKRRDIMKKTIAMLLALVMVFALCACGQTAAPAPAAEAPAAEAH